jgi:hypothetical protein
MQSVKSVGQSAGDIRAMAGGMTARTTTMPRERGLASVRVQGIPVRRWVQTTPGRMRVLSIALVAIVLVVGVVAWTTAQSRHTASREVGLDASPQLVASETLYGALADADAAASTAYLQPGTTDDALLRRYDGDVSTAGTSLARIGREVGSDPAAAAALATITRRFPEYTGLIEQARANNRMGHSVGAAYLRQASRLMQQEILPSATVLYVLAAQRLDDAYTSGTARTDLVWLGLAGLVALALFVTSGIYLARRTRRALNVGVLTAFALSLVVVVWTVAQFTVSDSALVSAQRNGSDAVQTLSVSRILLLRAYNDDNLALIARGNGTEYLTDYSAVQKTLTRMLPTAGAVAARTGNKGIGGTLGDKYAAVQKQHEAVRKLDDQGNNFAASKLATTEERQAVAALDQTLANEIARTRVILLDRAADARRGFTVLLVVLPFLVFAAAAALLVGFKPRIEEYR